MASVWSLRQEQALLWCKWWCQSELIGLTATATASALNSGKSGSGKSSAQSLLLRYFDVRPRVSSAGASY